MSKYHLNFSPEFIDNIENFKKSGNKSVLRKINSLLKELKEHPRTGTGKPEQLKYSAIPNCWSRRVTKEHRLVYSIEDDIVVVYILSAFGHYDD